MRVLIVKVSALGDVVHALPVLDYLHQVSPGIEVDWIVEAPFREMLEGNPLISRLFTVRTKQWRRNLLAGETRREIAGLREELAGRAYDIVFDIQGNFKSGLITRLVGCGRRYGFDRDAVREPLNLLFTNNQVPLRRQDHHVSARSLRMVSVPFGRDYSGMALATDIHTSPEDDSAAEALFATLSDGLIFVFHQGTTWETKMWHEPGWIELGHRTLARFPDSTILFSWGNDREREAAERVMTAIGRGTRILPKLTLKGLTAVLKRADLVVGGDTGPVHIAAAVGTPTLSFFRATDPKRNAPKGDSHLQIQSPFHCRVCLRKACDKDLACRESITPEMMLQGIEKLLK